MRWHRSAIAQLGGIYTKAEVDAMSRGDTRHARIIRAGWSWPEEEFVLLTRESHRLIKEAQHIGQEIDEILTERKSRLKVASNGREFASLHESGDILILLQRREPLP